MSKLLPLQDFPLEEPDSSTPKVVSVHIKKYSVWTIRQSVLNEE